MRAITKVRIIPLLAICAAAASIARAESSVSELWAKSLAAETDGDYVYALKHHKQVLSLGEKSYAANLRAGWLFYMNADYQTAVGCYENASKLSSGAVNPLLGRMNCHAALGETSQAVKAAKAVLVIDERNYSANLKLAAIYYQEKEFSLAAAYYRKLNRLYPADLAVASGLAWSFLEQGEARRAAPLFKQILIVSPDYAYAARGLSICERIASR